MYVANCPYKHAKYGEVQWTLAVSGCTCLQGAREVDDARHAAAKAEAEAAGLRAALDAARTRHFEQLTK